MPYEVSMGAGLAHRLELEGRERLTVSGVEDVERFDESTIVMATCAGTMVTPVRVCTLGSSRSTAGRCTSTADRRGKL